MVILRLFEIWFLTFLFCSGVCAFVGGGGYAEKVVVQQVLPLPRNLNLESAACLPFVACTVRSELFATSKLSPLTF